MHRRFWFCQFCFSWAFKSILGIEKRHGMIEASAFFLEIKILATAKPFLENKQREIAPLSEVRFAELHSPVRLSRNRYAGDMYSS